MHFSPLSSKLDRIAYFFAPILQESLQETTIRESMVKTVGENEGIHPHIG
jgi:hypothetical protein